MSECCDSFRLTAEHSRSCKVGRAAEPSKPAGWAVRAAHNIILSPVAVTTCREGHATSVDLTECARIIERESPVAELCEALVRAQDWLKDIQRDYAAGRDLTETVNRITYQMLLNDIDRAEAALRKARTP